LAIAESELVEAETVEPARPRWRNVLGWVVTGLAAVVVFYGLTGPDRLSRLGPLIFVRIPIEGLLAAGLFLVLPNRARKIVALVLGALLGLVTIAKVFDMGFFASLDRPFDPFIDLSFLPSGVDYLERTYGHTLAVLAVVGAIVLAASVLTLTGLAMLRLSNVAVRHRAVTMRAAVALGVVWILLAAFDVQFVRGEPVAAYSPTRLGYATVNQYQTDKDDEKTFATRFASDPFAKTPGSAMLTGLRGKNVVLTFVESYGRVAIQDSDIAPQIDTLLDQATSSLQAAGYSARSGFLTSSTAGGGSWLAHSTVQSGLFINTQQRYDQLTQSNRLTLASAFKRAGWQTTDVTPATREDWPEGRFYQFDSIMDSRTMGYKGKNYSFDSIPDQYTMAEVQRTLFASPPPKPTFTEIDLVSSHAPWEPVPPLLDWNTIGDGSGLTGATGSTDPTSTVFQETSNKVHSDYARTIEYSLTTLVQYIERYGDENMVMVFLGDHQPAPVVTGEGADRDVPITIVAKDPKVLDQVASWGWQDGLRPKPDAPIWRMDQFRDKFLSAFGSKMQTQ
jgi:hypothetical protein